MTGQIMNDYKWINKIQINPNKNSNSWKLITTNNAKKLIYRMNLSRKRGVVKQSSYLILFIFYFFGDKNESHLLFWIELIDDKCL